jgi:hypothetical protein
MISPSPLPASRAHLSRLMKIWRSAGWPSRDPIELDLLAAGLLSEEQGEQGRETLRLTEQGFAVLAASRQRNLRAMSRHERLVSRVARQLSEAGRLVWLELSLRAHVQGQDQAPGAPEAAATAADEPAYEPADLGLWDDACTAHGPSPSPATKGQWRMARPDVFSVRHTSVEAYLQPVVHEIKVSRADLLSDLRNAAKRESYQWLCGACYYVFPAGIAKPNEIPEAFGVWVIHGDLDTGRLEQLRPARHSVRTLPFPVWMALARSAPWRPDTLDDPQSSLGHPDSPSEPITSLLRS